MISHRHRCIFVHIPKTGGTSIENVIWPGERSTAELWMGFTAPYRNKYQTGGLQHLKANHIRAEVGPEIFAAYFKFAFVRNPWDKVISQWSYLAERPDLQTYLGVKAGAPLVDYLAAVSGSDHVQVMAQSAFLFDDDGTCLVDFIGRFETLAADAANIFARLGLGGAALPHTTRSKRQADYRAYYDAPSRRLVANLYARDIEAFGYSF
jgi:hypothetical protein